MVRYTLNASLQFAVDALLPVALVLAGLACKIASITVPSTSKIQLTRVLLAVVARCGADDGVLLASDTVAGALRVALGA